MNYKLKIAEALKRCQIFLSANPSGSLMILEWYYETDGTVTGYKGNPFFSPLNHAAILRQYCGFGGSEGWWIQGAKPGASENIARAGKLYALTGTSSSLTSFSIVPVSRRAADLLNSGKGL